MSSPYIGLGDVANMLLSDNAPRYMRRRDKLFGAIGSTSEESNASIIEAALAAIESKVPRKILTQGSISSPKDRMFNTKLGQSAIDIVGDKLETLKILEWASSELIAESLLITMTARASDRIIIMPSFDETPAVVMILSPDINNVDSSKVISDEIDLPLTMFERIINQLASPMDESPTGKVMHYIAQGGQPALAELFLITKTEVILSRRPRMIPLCVPSPYMTVRAEAEKSTAGIFCRDQDGEFGITACYHGTGPNGTRVMVEGVESFVKYANEVQDTVFIPLDENAVDLSRIKGRGGVLADRQPSPSDYVQFDGAANQNCTTRILGADRGLLRARTSLQLKIQTDPDTDQGDSGSALIDQEDRVLGFAFERTAYDDHPQFTDWIWAANALRALKLTPTFS